MKVFIPYLRTFTYLSNENLLETLKIFSAIFSVTISLHFVHIFIFDFSLGHIPLCPLWNSFPIIFENLEKLVNKNSPNTFQIVSFIFSTMLSLHFVNIFIFDFLSETSSSHFHYEGCCSIFWESYLSNEEIFTTCIPKMLHYHFHDDSYLFCMKYSFWRFFIFMSNPFFLWCSVLVI